MIEQKERAKVPAKKMKQYSSAKSVSNKGMDIPDSSFPMKNKADGSMDYLSVQDKTTNADSAKIKRGYYKDCRYE